MRTAILIASCDRPEMLHQTVASLQLQKTRADRIILSVSSSQDIANETRLLPSVEVVFAQKKSLPIQRNAALGLVPSDTELVVFLDDDVELASDYLELAQQYFTIHKDVAAMCGDSTDGESVATREAARAFLNSSSPKANDDRPSRGLYGCNMNVRAEVARKVGFDERLMFYAFMEDHDFGARCEVFGRVTQYFGCRLVHFRESSGRISKEMLGYGQMMNSYYLWRKGSVYASEFIARGPRFLLANVRGLLLGLGERRGRWEALCGNLRALKDIVLNGAVPERIVKT
jgi:hypothetical protein